MAPPKSPREKSPSYLQPDMDAFGERKARNKRLPVKLMWYEYSRNAERQELEAYCYQTFCEMFAEAENRSDARKRFEHLPGEKAYIGWALPVFTGNAQPTSTERSALRSTREVARIVEVYSW